MNALANSPEWGGIITAFECLSLFAKHFEKFWSDMEFLVDYTVKKSDHVEVREERGRRAAFVCVCVRTMVHTMVYMRCIRWCTCGPKWEECATIHIVLWCLLNPIV